MFAILPSLEIGQGHDKLLIRSLPRHCKWPLVKLRKAGPQLTSVAQSNACTMRSPLVPGHQPSQLSWSRCRVDRPDSLWLWFPSNAGHRQAAPPPARRGSCKQWWSAEGYHRNHQPLPQEHQPYLPFRQGSIFRNCWQLTKIPSAPYAPNSGQIVPGFTNLQHAFDICLLSYACTYGTLRLLKGLGIRWWGV